VTVAYFLNSYMVIMICILEVIETTQLEQNLSQNDYIIFPISCIALDR